MKIRGSVARCCCGVGEVPGELSLHLPVGNTFGWATTDAGRPMQQQSRSAWNKWDFFDPAFTESACASNFQVNLPQGHRVIEAKLVQLEGWSTSTDSFPPQAQAVVRLNIEAANVANGLVSNDPADWRNAPRTSARTFLVEDHNNPAPAPVQADITDVVQEILNRPDWVSGNSIALIIENQSSDVVQPDVEAVFFQWPATLVATPASYYLEILS